METQMRRIPVRLPASDFEVLVGLAEREERTPSQQAAWLVRRALAVKDAGVNPAGSPDDPGRAA